MVTLILAGLATSVSVAGIHIEDGWARATVEGTKTGGAFMKIQDDEAKQGFLVGGNSPVAERVGVHTHVNDNGVMRMRKVKGGVPLIARGVTELRPGSYHAMFVSLKKQLKEDEKVPVALKFKNAKPQTAELEVKAAPKIEMQHDHGAHGGVCQH